MPAHLFHKVCDGGYGPARSQKIVHYQYPVAGFERVLMDLKGIFAVLKVIGNRVRLVRKLPFLADGYQACPKFIRNCRATLCLTVERKSATRLLPVQQLSLIF